MLDQVRSGVLGGGRGNVELEAVARVRAGVGREGETGGCLDGWQVAGEHVKLGGGLGGVKVEGGHVGRGGGSRCWREH